jgi:hypothetical protein
MGMIARLAAASLSHSGVDMLVRVRRPTASLCIALLALNMVACTHIKREEAQAVIQPVGSNVKMEKIVGVTLKDGRDIRFDRSSPPVLRGDTLQAIFGRQPFVIPVSDLQQVWVQSISATRTTILAVAGVMIVGMISSLASTDLGF